MKHTSGPWSLTVRKSKRAHEHGYRATVMARGHRVAIVDGPSNVDERETWLANALLIRCAPQLLNALSFLVRACETEPEMAIYRAHIEDAKALIALAVSHD